MVDDREDIREDDRYADFLERQKSAGYSNDFDSREDERQEINKAK